jgi:phosphatidylglycerophosphate synthase
MTARRRPTLRETRKQRPGNELVCEAVFRPLAQVVVRALLPFGVPPLAVLFASCATGLAAAWLIGDGNLLAGAIVLQVKTVLDNADGQLARASGRVTLLGRYLDSESDLLVDAALFGALGYVTGEYWVALAAFLVLTAVLSVDFNLDRLYRREHGEPVAPEAAEPTRAERFFGRVYALVYGWQDRLIEAFVESRLRGESPAARRAYHDRATVQVLTNFGLSTQLAVLGICLAAGHPAADFAVVFACGLALVPLAWRRERLLASP